MKYFVTGATGFIGGAVTRQLVDAGHEVVAIVRDPSRAGGLSDLGVALHCGDVTDKESMRSPMSGADGVFHIAGWYRVGARDKSPAEQINVKGTRNVLELMRELEIPKGVYTSSIAVFSDTGGRVVDESYYHSGPWISEYDRTKWRAHYLVAEPLIRQGLPLVITMPGVVYGPGDNSSIRTTLVQYLQRKLPILPRGSAYCWAPVEDTARGHILAMERGKVGESYILAGPVHSLIEVLDLAEKLTGIAAPRLHPSPPMMKLAAAMAGLLERLIPLPELYSSETLRTSAGVTYLGSNSKAKRELGYQVRSLEEGLPTTLQHELKLLGIGR